MTCNTQLIFWPSIGFRCTYIFLENWSNRCQLQAIWKLWTLEKLLKYIVKIFCFLCCEKVLIIL